MPSPKRVEEHTIRADDITGANECPLYLRITAMDILPYQERVTYVNGGSLKESMRYDPEIQIVKNNAVRKKIWAIIDGVKIETTFLGLAGIIKVNANSISAAKRRALALNSAATEYTIQGVRFGW